MPEVLGLIIPLPLYALACPVGMGVMMWLMMRGGRHNPQMGQPPMPMGSSFDQTTDQTIDRETELARMRAEIDQLRAAQAERDNSPNVGHR